VILLAGHFIGLPLAVRALAERVPLRVVARMFRHRLFQLLLARLGHRTGGGLIDGANGRAICRSLMQGETILILADYGMAGTSQSAASHVSRLARRSGAVVLPLHYHRHGRVHQLCVGRPLPLVGLTAEALQSLYATWIQESPAEYLWPHDP
jgi:lauroyl/myristoyl acyltransferase